MIKGFRQIASLTALSRVFGMLRDMSFAYFLGASGLMDGWVIAFRIPNLARRLFGEGAAASSLIPIYSEQLETNPKEAQKFACTVITTIALLLIAVVLVGEGVIWGYYSLFSTSDATNVKLALSGIMLPYMILICLVALLAGLLNAHGHFATPAAAPIILNLFIIGSLFFAGWVLKLYPDHPVRQIAFVAFAVVAAGFLQILVQFLALRTRGVHIRPAWQVKSEAFKKTMVLMGPMILGLTATQINTLADDFTALWLSGSEAKGEFFHILGMQIRYPVWEGTVSRLFYAQRLYQFPLGVLGISLATAIFPVMSSSAAKKDYRSLYSIISRGLRGTMFIAIPAIAGLLLIGRILVAVLFQRGEFSASDTTYTTYILWFYALGLAGYFAQQICTRAFYSTQDSKTPMRSAVIAVILNIALNLVLIWFMGAPGLALSTALCSYLQVTILLIALYRKFGSSIFQQLPVSIAKTTVATMLMSAVVGIALFIFRNLPNTTSFNLLRIAAAVPAAVVVYLFAAKFLRIEALSLLTGRDKQIPDNPVDLT